MANLRLFKLSLSGSSWALLGFMLIQLVLAFCVLPLTGRQALFPFSRWDLFSAPVQERVVPLIYIYRAGGQVFDPPIEAHRFFQKSGSYVRYIEAHDYMAKDLRRLRSEGRSEFSQDVVEGAARVLFASSQPVEFEMREAHINSVDFFSRGQVLSETILGHYTFLEGEIRAH